MCLFRKVKQVPRAGTAGYRAPEVLLGSCEQTSAIDIWSAGVILLSLFSGYYPFFKPKSDISASAELISVFGTTVFVKVSDSLKIELTVRDIVSGTGLEVYCCGLHQDEQFALLSNLLTVDPASRIKATDALTLLMPPHTK